MATDFSTSLTTMLAAIRRVLERADTTFIQALEAELQPSALAGIETAEGIFDQLDAFIADTAEVRARLRMNAERIRERLAPGGN